MGMFGHHGPAAWAIFSTLVLVLLALDLGVVHRQSRVFGIAESVLWNVVWTAIGLAFGGFVIWRFGHASGVEYFTGYVLERALSVDNVFVFVVIFRYFAVPPEHQQRGLYWGIIMALVLRGALILAGAAAVARFHWVLYFFGAFLVWTAIQMVAKDEEAPHPERNPVVRLAARAFPTTPRFHEGSFFVRIGGRLHATPMFVVLLVLATSDLVFALDSIPAIFGVTEDPYVIVTSNVFAVLGLRAMYFLIAALLPLVRYLKYGLALILAFIGARMLADPWVEIPTGLTLFIVCATLCLSVLASLLPRRR